MEPTRDPAARLAAELVAELAADLAADGEPEREFDPGIAARLPRKGTAAAALLRDAAGRVLLVDPVYKPGWEFPGGVCEAGEPPLVACRRELQEELGLHLRPERLLVVDWAPPLGPWPDALLFVFDGGVLSADAIAALRTPADELHGIHLVDLAEVAAHVRPSMLRRLTVALQVATTDAAPAYLHFGRRVFGP